MSFTSQGRSLAFPFRVAAIQKIFAEELLSDDDTVTNKVFQRYDPNTGLYKEDPKNNLDVNGTILANLNEHGSKSNVNDAIRKIAGGIASSITRNDNMALVAKSGVFSAESQRIVKRTTQPYSLPEEMIKTFENPDNFAMPEDKLNQFRKNIISSVALQGAEFIQHMFRLSAKFFQNKMPTKIRYSTQQGYDEMGLYRVVLYCDLSDGKFTSYFEQINRLYTMRNVGLDKTNGLVPFVFLVMVFKSPDSKPSMLTDLYIRFEQDLANEYNQHIEPLMRQAANTDSFPYNPRNVDRTFWTLHYADQGIEDLAARVVIRSYPDFFPPLDSNTLEYIWQCKTNIVPCFNFEGIVKKIGQDMLNNIKASYGSWQTNWQNITDFEMREYLTKSPYAFCNPLTPKDCSFPLAIFVRNLFNSTVKGNHTPLMFTKDVVNFFVFSYDSDLRRKNSEIAKSVFSQEPTKEMFPAKDQITAIVYHLVVGYCFYLEKDKIKWTNPAYETLTHPSPWQVLIERADDINSPTTAVSNYTGLRRFIQHLDVLLFSFVGGYIMQSNDQVCAVHFRKIRVALLRMGFLESKDLGFEYQNFVNDANSPGLVHRLESTRTNYDYIAGTVRTANQMTGGYSNNQSDERLEQPNYRQPETLDAITYQSRQLMTPAKPTTNRRIVESDSTDDKISSANLASKLEMIRNTVGRISPESKSIDGRSISQIYQQLRDLATYHLEQKTMDDLSNNERKYLTKIVLADSILTNPKFFETQNIQSTLFDADVLAFMINDPWFLFGTGLPKDRLADVPIHHDIDTVKKEMFYVDKTTQDSSRKNLLDPLMGAFELWYLNKQDDDSITTKEYKIGFMVATLLRLLAKESKYKLLKARQSEYVPLMESAVLETMRIQTAAQNCLDSQSPSLKPLRDLMAEYATRLQTTAEQIMRFVQEQEEAAIE